MAKNYKNYNINDVVRIIQTHGDDLHRTGKIVEVRCSFCKIHLFDADGNLAIIPNSKNKPDIRNHTYGQFEKI